MLRDMCATVRMEEKLLRMVVEFNNTKSKEKIYKAIDRVEKQMNIHPCVTSREISSCVGNVSIEFDVSGARREAGVFFEKIMTELDIGYCDI